MTEDEFEKLQDLKGLIQWRTGQSATESGQKADFPITLRGFHFLFCQSLSKTKPISRSEEFQGL